MLRLGLFPGIVTVVAWEKRERGGIYYTRSGRENGRVVREYVGTGEIAELRAVADEAMRLERERKRAEERAELGRLRELAAPALELSELAEILARAHIVAGGYRNHKGEWRKRRDA